MKLRSFLGGLLALFLCFSLAVAAAPGKANALAAQAVKPRQLDMAGKPWTGDFEALLDRRVIRILAPYSRTLYFNDRGRERGVTADTMRDFERYLNKKYKKRLGKRPLTVVIVPTTRDKLLSKLAAGLGDIAAGNLTVTEERLQQVDFFTPADLRRIDEIVVSGAGRPALSSADELSGKSVHVRQSSSYRDSLIALNARLKQAGQPLVDIVLVPDALEDEDLMEMVGAGLFEWIVVDDWKARMWAQILPTIRLHPAAAVRSGGQVGWAVRQGSPELLAALDDFYRTNMQKSKLVEQRLKQYMMRVKQIKNSTGDDDWQRFEATIALFKKYGERYNFDPLMLAAQGFQESGLDQRVKSPVGAIGIMQVMPATGAELGVGSIHVADANIHAGAKYMDILMSKNFPDAHFSDANRPLFAFASYNCGPGNVAKMRKEAVKRGLDPDLWFNNVELVVAGRIGMETTNYVRNIYKYYVAYRLTQDAIDAARAAREKLETTAK